MSNLPPPSPEDFEKQKVVLEAQKELARINSLELRREIENSRFSRSLGRVLIFIFTAVGLLIGVGITIAIWRDPSIDIGGKLLFWLLVLPPIIGFVGGAALGSVIHEALHKRFKKVSRN